MKKFEVANHEPSYLPEEKNWKLVWSDEFDGTALDESKWNYRMYYWGKKSPTFTDEVVLDGESHLHIPLIYRDGVFKSAHLQTGGLTFDLPRDEDANGFWPFGKKVEYKFMHKYGYYEIRCKLPKNDGWHAAFWLQAPGIGSHPDPAQCGVECDIMENYLLATKGMVIGGIGYGGYGKESVWPGHFRVPYVETEDGWHTYAVDWSKDGYIFYYDGVEIGRQMAPEFPVSNIEQFLLVSTECHGYHRMFSNECAESTAAGDAKVWGGKAVDALYSATLPDEFIVDYVRVFDEVEE